MSFCFRIGRLRAALGVALLLGATRAVAAPAALPPPVIAPPVLHDARSYVLMDFQTGQVLAQKAPNLQLPPASLTKLMTAYLAYGALADGKLRWSETVPVSKVAWHTGGSSMFIQPALPVTVDQLMHGLIIDSGNDAAVALAQAIAGSRAAFVAQMNTTAAALKLTGTHYSDVDGLPRPDLHTSALDIARLSRALIQRYPQVIDISRIKTYRYAGITQRSWNPALFHHPSVDGLKTGHTRAAGYCMDVTAVRGGRRLIAVVMGTPNWATGVSDSLSLLDYGYRFTRNHTVAKPGQTLGVYRNVGLQPDKVPVELGTALTVTAPRGERPQLHVSIDPGATAIAGGIHKGQVLGMATVTLAGKRVAEAPLRAAVAAAPAGFFGTLWNRLRQHL